MINQTTKPFYCSRDGKDISALMEAISTGMYDDTLINAQVADPTRMRGQQRQVRFLPEEIVTLLRQGATLESIGKKYGVSRQRIQQVGRKHPAYQEAVLSGRLSRLVHFCRICQEPISSDGRKKLCKTCAPIPRYCECGCGIQLGLWKRRWASAKCAAAYKWRTNAKFREEQNARSKLWAAKHPWQVKLNGMLWRNRRRRDKEVEVIANTHG